MVLSSNGKTAATIHDDNIVRLWNAETGEEIAKIPHGKEVDAVNLSSDGKTVATITGDSLAWLWNAETGEEIAKLPHGKEVDAVNLSLDGKIVGSPGISMLK